MRCLHPFILATAFVLVWTGIAGARAVQIFTFQERFEKFDLVVIAKPVVTQDLPEETVLPGIAPAVHVVGVDTGFDLSRVIKGDKSLKQAVLHHYRLANPKVPTVTGPMLVSFDPADKTSYLLFLKKEADGRLAPAFGQTDPGLCGILRIDTTDLMVVAKPVSATKQVDETIWANVSPTGTSDGVPDGVRGAGGPERRGAGKELCVPLL